MVHPESNHDFGSKSALSLIKVDIIALKLLYFKGKYHLKSTKRVFVSDKKAEIWIKLTVSDPGSN